MATKAEVEQELAEAQARIAELETGQGSDTGTVDSDLPSPTENKAKFLKELEDMDGAQEEDEDTYYVNVWAHRLESDAFVRAFAWARKRGNELKACLIYADAHELDFENSEAPVVKRD